MKKAILLVGHGSAMCNANATMKQLAREVHKHYPGYQLECVFLEAEHPTIAEGLERVVKKGAEFAMLIPYFLQAGHHVQKEIPAIVEREKKKYSKVQIALAPFLGFHEALVTVVLERIREADVLGAPVSYD